MRCIFFMIHYGWISQHNGVTRNINIYITVWRYYHIISYADLTHYGCVYAYIHIVSYLRRSNRSTIRRAQRTAFMQIHIVSKHYIRTNRYIIRVSPIQSFSDHSIFRNFQTILARQMVQHYSCKRRFVMLIL